MVAVYFLVLCAFYCYRHGHGHSREYGNGHDQAHGRGHGHGHGREQGHGYDLFSGSDRDLTLMLLATWPCLAIDQASAFFLIVTLMPVAVGAPRAERRARPSAVDSSSQSVSFKSQTTSVASLGGGGRWRLQLRPCPKGHRGGAIRLDGTTPLCPRGRGLV